MTTGLATVNADTVVVSSNQPKSSGLEAVNGIGAGAQMTTAMGGGIGSGTTLVETDSVQSIQKVIQFSIDNSAAGSSNVKLRIGSQAALPGNYVLFGITAGAADDVVIQDQNGVGCKALQAFGIYVSFKPVIVGRIKVYSSDTNQLAEPLLQTSLQLDGSIPIQKRLNMAYTQSLADNRTNLVEMQLAAILDATKYLEYTVTTGVKLTLFVEIAAISNNETFTAV